MTQLEKGMALIIAVFNRYSGDEGNQFSLSKGELKTLILKELPNFVACAKDKSALDKLMNSLDEDGDAELDFNEFVVFVSAVACICHKRLANQASTRR